MEQPAGKSCGTCQPLEAAKDLAHRLPLPAGEQGGGTQGIRPALPFRRAQRKSLPEATAVQPPEKSLRGNTSYSAVLRIQWNNCSHMEHYFCNFNAQIHKFSVNSAYAIRSTSSKSPGPHRKAGRRRSRRRRSRAVPYGIRLRHRL